MIIIVSICASVAAFAGGLLALRFRDKLHIILGFSAGTVIGAALFDLIPEAAELGASSFHLEDITALMVIGFLFYLVLDRIFLFHSHNSHDHEEYNHSRASLGAASFCLHSLIDGVAIGLAFQASATVGAVVSIAVLAHRFSDGINTVGVILKHRGVYAHTWKWLTAVALAPIVGAAITRVISVSDTVLAAMLAIFAGFFLYIGASDLIPEGHHSHSKILTTIMTIIGAAALYVLIGLVH